MPGPDVLDAGAGHLGLDTTDERTLQRVGGVAALALAASYLLITGL
jgi:hypothetical protein